MENRTPTNKRTVAAAEKKTGLSSVSNLILLGVLLAILCSLFMVFAAIYSHKMNVVYYLIVFVVIEIIGACFKGGKKV